MPRRISSRRKLSRWVDLAPWLLVALLLHAVIFLLAYVSVPEPSVALPDITAVTIVTEPNPYRGSPTRPQEPPLAKTPDAEPDAPAAEPEPPEPIPMEELAAANPEPLPNPVTWDQGDDVDSLVVSAESGGNGPASSKGFDPFGNRSGSGRDQALGDYGGTAETDEAMAAGLSWLAAHQEQDGSWDRLRFNHRCPGSDQCGGIGIRWVELDASPGITGLATLAFLGAGNTHRQGPYRETVAGALRYLLSRQRPNGSFSNADRMEMYNDAIVTIVLAEGYTLSRDQALRNSLQAAVDHLVQAQQAGGGWDYRSDPRSDRNDTSVTGWVLMALKAAATAGIDIPDRTLLGITDHFTRSTDDAGLVWYADRGTGTDEDSDGTLLRFGPAMVAVGMLGRTWLGVRPDADILRRQAEQLLGEPPDPAKLKGGDPTGLHSYYYWYHGALAMFLRGGPDWLEWNNRLRDAVLAMQNRDVSGAGRPRHSFGSWPPLGPGWGKWGRTGGRVYSTAISVLTLQTYYRYVPTYASGRPLLSPQALRIALRETSGTDRLRYAMFVCELSMEVAEPVLVDFLGAPEPRTQLVAAMGLARFGNPVGTEVLQSHLPTAAAHEHKAIQSALDSLGALTFGPQYGRVIRIDRANQLVVFETNGLSTYYSQAAHIIRQATLVSSATVLRRSPNGAMAVARVQDPEAVAVGDQVVNNP